jgi:signal transduction histidine kinase
MTYQEPYGPHRRGIAAVARPVWLPAVVVAFVQVVGSSVAGRHQADRVPLDALGYLLLFAGPALLLLRRRRPVPVAAATGAVTLLYVALGYPWGPVFVSLVVAFFSAVAAGHRKAVLVIAALAFAGHVLVGEWLYRWLPPDDDHRMPWTGLSGSAAWLLAVLAAAELFRVRREQIARDRRERAQAERRRADGERMRIARELHDVLAHSISLINVQAGVALALIDERPEQARTALTTIKAASREALGEVRQVLSTLRAPGEAPRSPAPGLDRLPELVEQADAAGLTAQVAEEGVRAPLPPGADLAAFRIVQEALTNIVRHSGARTARVRLAYRPGRLEVTVDDDGPAVAGGESGGGNGLAGMRERAVALGGTVETGPRPDGGFRVRARLPLGPPARQRQQDPAVSDGVAGAPPSDRGNCLAADGTATGTSGADRGPPGGAGTPGPFSSAPAPDPDADPDPDPAPDPDRPGSAEERP